MKKQFYVNTLIQLLIALFCSALFSCDVMWNGDLQKRLAEDTSTKIYFYSPDETHSTTRTYKIGATLYASDLPLDTDSDSEAWIQEYKVGAWRDCRWKESGEAVTDHTVITVDEKNTVVSIKVPADELTLYAVCMVPYTVIYREQKTDGTYTETKEERRGEPGTMTDVTVEERTGFITPTVENKLIEADGSTEIVVEYSRKTITITLDAGEGAFADGAKTKTLTGLYGAPVEDVEKPTWTSAKPFDSWNPPLPETFGEDGGEALTCTALYFGQEFSITYCDWNGTNEGKTLSGTASSIANLPVTYEYGTEMPVSLPVLNASEADNAQFDGWYTDKDAMIELDKRGDAYYISAKTAGDLTLYAKWKVHCVYVDPAPDSSGADSRNGFAADSSVRTVAEAKTILANAFDDPAIKLLNEISSADDIQALNGLTTPEYHNAVLQRAAGYDSRMITVNVSSSLSDITIDGENIPSTITPIYVDNAGQLTLASVAIKDFEIKNELITVSENGVLTLADCVIKDNVISSKYAVHCDSGATLNMSGETAIDENTPVYLAENCAVTITGALTENPVAAIFSEVYKTAPVVLEDNAGGSLVKAHYTQFTSAHEKYTIYNDGVLSPPRSGGDFEEEMHAFSFALSPEEITKYGEQTLTVTATVTTTKNDGTSTADPGLLLTDSTKFTEVSIKVFCDGQESTTVSVSGGTVTIPAALPNDTYTLEIRGTYHCPNGCTETFLGLPQFTVNRL